MSFSHTSNELTLRRILRNPVGLSQEDSMQRFVQLTRFEPYNTLPVLQGGRVVGMISQEDFLLLLAETDELLRERKLNRPVSDYMKPASAVIRPEMSLQEIRELFANSGKNTLPVADENGYCLGIVNAGDLLAPSLPAPRPSQIGGMATPFGVYLTDGARQAGVGSWALIASGFLMSLLFIGSFLLVQGGIYAGLSLAHRTPLAIALLSDDIVSKNPWIAFGVICISLLNTFVFLSLMRLSPLAGFHSAEHQTVHAIERGENLDPEIVARMPRAHPRCGTNLIAGMLVFFTMRQILTNLPLGTGGVEAFGDLIAGMTTLFTWRRVGTFLQERFTTKPASLREIESGVAAGAELLEKYRSQPPERLTFFRRIWCMGMLQMMIGSLPVYAIVTYLLKLNPYFVIHF